MRDVKNEQILNYVSNLMGDVTNNTWLLIIIIFMLAINIYGTFKK